MTKPKPEGEKVYRGKQSYLTEEQIKMLKGNPNIVNVFDKLKTVKKFNLSFEFWTLFIKFNPLVKV